jgi:hypothetical protein
MEGSLPPAFLNSLNKLIDQLIIHRPSKSEIFQFSEYFFINEKAENPKIAHLLKSLKKYLKIPEMFTKLSAELFELALGKKSSLYISKEEALNYCKKLLEESSDDSNIQTYEEINIFSNFLDQLSQIGFKQFECLLRLSLIFRGNIIHHDLLYSI